MGMREHDRERPSRPAVRFGTALRRVIFRLGVVLAVVSIGVSGMATAAQRGGFAPADAPVFTLPGGPGQDTVELTASSGPLAVDGHGQVTVTGTVACDQPGSVSVRVQLTEAATDGGRDASGFVEPSNCSATPSAWSVTLSGVPLPFVDGPAHLTVSAVNFQVGVGTARLERDVELTGAAPLPADAEYQVALGDSLATGFAADPGQGYVELLHSHYAQTNPHLVLANFGCSGETTMSMLGGFFCRYGGQGQEDAAVAFLRAHRGHIAFLTIDIGGNDVVFCRVGDQACFDRSLATVDKNLVTILQRLRDAAGPDVPFYAMNYFDPLLNDWLLGPDGQADARLTVTLADELNRHLATDYWTVGAPTADVARAYAIDDFTIVPGTQWGEVPRNVVNACNWLDIGCVVGGPEQFGDDANAAGYQVIARTFEQVIDGVAPPAPIPPAAPPPTATSSPTTTPSVPATDATPTASASDPATASTPPSTAPPTTVGAAALPAVAAPVSATPAFTG
jgi:lysophospholipase L1-like esterase